MQVFLTFDELPPMDRSVITLGNFDGVHLGHQALISSVVQESHRLNVPSVLITFHPHPAVVTRPDKHFRHLSSFTENVEIMEKSGIDILLRVEFTRHFAEIRPMEFLNSHVRKYLHPEVIFIGYDHRFGRDRDGNFDTLKEFGEREGVRVIMVPPYMVEGRIVSSSAIRDYILAGNLRDACKMLGRPFRLSGDVQEGCHRGGLLGIPTANLHLPDRILPPAGVYASMTAMELVSRPSITYIGQSPTFGGGDIRIETHVFDFNGNIYGNRLCVDLICMIRTDRVFKGEEELVHQMKEDILQAKQVFERMSNASETDHGGVG